jgi:hypothetical protein
MTIRTALLSALLLGAAGTALADDAALLACRARTDSAARLACYDAIPTGARSAAAPDQSAGPVESTVVGTNASPKVRRVR